MAVQFEGFFSFPMREIVEATERNSLFQIKDYAEEWGRQRESEMQKLWEPLSHTAFGRLILLRSYFVYEEGELVDRSILILVDYRIALNN